MLKIAVLAVAVTVAGPTYSGTFEDRDVERAAQRVGETQALSTLIQRQWTEGEASERGIVITSHEVDEALEESFTSRKAFKAYLKQTGQTEPEARATVRTDQLTTKIRDQVTEPAAKSVTPDQVKAYVDANPQLRPEQRTVRVVTTKNRSQAVKVLRKLRRGATFSSVGGTREEYDRADKTAPGRAVFRAELNQLTRYGRIVFKVIKHAPAKPLPRAQQEAMAWELLASQAQQRALDEFTVQFTAKWRERTTCAPRYGRHQDCRQPPSGQHGP